MSDGFKIPVWGGTPDPFQPGDHGGDLKPMQYATLGLYAFAAVILPTYERVLLGYGLSVPADPQVMHRAADGWSAVGNGVYAAGRTAQEQHDSVSLAAWQSPDRELYGQNVAQYAMASTSASDSAQSLSWLMRVMANTWTVYIYYHFGSASLTMMNAAKSLLLGPGKGIWAQVEAQARAYDTTQRIIAMRNFVLLHVLGLVVKWGAGWMTDHALTEGLKPEYGAGGPKAGTVEA
jgi:hypothetical protein